MTYRERTRRQSGVKFVDSRPEDWPFRCIEREVLISVLDGNDEDGAVGCRLLESVLADRENGIYLGFRRSFRPQNSRYTQRGSSGSILVPVTVVG